MIQFQKMAGAGTGAVFFLGTRAHYQVLQAPEARSYDVENGNASTVSANQNSAVREEEQTDKQLDNALNLNENCNIDEMAIKRRNKRCSSEITLCERDNDMKPALLNNLDSEATKSKPSRTRVSLIAFLARLAKRAKGTHEEQGYALQSALTVCSYREACRCLDCQSRYFECDDSEEYSSDDSEYSRYLQDYFAPSPVQEIQREMEDEDDDDEVFIDTVPGDNTSTDLLIEADPPPQVIEKMSISSDDVDDASLQLEVAAGTPALLNYLLNHPITCAIQ